MKRFLQYLREDQNAFSAAYQGISNIAKSALDSMHNPAKVERALDKLAGHHGTIMAMRANKGEHNEQIFDLYRHASKEWTSVTSAAIEHGHFEPGGALRQHAELEGMKPDHPINFVNPHQWKRRSIDDVVPYDRNFTMARNPIPASERNARPLGESILWLMEKHEAFVDRQKI